MTALRARAAGCELDTWVERFCAELQAIYYRATVSV